jgi:hypothetical protein
LSRLEEDSADSQFKYLCCKIVGNGAIGDGLKQQAIGNVRERLAQRCPGKALGNRPIGDHIKPEASILLTELQRIRHRCEPDIRPPLDQQFKPAHQEHQVQPAYPNQEQMIEHW